VRFVFFVTVEAVWSISILKRAVHKYLMSDLLNNMSNGKHFNKMEDTGICLNVIAVAMSSAVMFFIGIQFFRHLYLLLKNRTRIENLICWTAEQMRNRENSADKYPEFIYPYDLGCWENFKTVMGHTGFKTNLPNFGLTDWPVIPGSNQFSVTIEHKSQKTYLNNLSKPATAIHSYNKSWFPLSYGFQIGFLQVPKTCQPRLKLKPGDKILIFDDVYWGSHWWLGEKKEGTKTLQGWFPAKAVKLTVEKKLKDE